MTSTDKSRPKNKRTEPLKWIDSTQQLPATPHVVFVHGGVACYRDGSWWTGMEYPQFTRKIQWHVTHWAELPVPPKRRLPRKDMGA